ncbi:MAG: hypothetical protein BWX88_03983 [Planctomycetes bacterium ADurb.Bin126]|nr:MAG: hypothetical protein BWX88_03983 [Planctomycetes bacterium ADurb.Bin126]HOD83203.1 glycoside hydrolase family 127 protein [Phycisphaerae bacterium]
MSNRSWRLAAWVAAGLMVTGSARAERPAPAVQDTFSPLPPASLVISGPAGSRMDLCIRNRVRVQRMEPLVAALASSQLGDDDARRATWGRWVVSLAQACRYRNDPNLRRLLDQAVQAALKACQGQDRPQVLDGLAAACEVSGEAASLAEATRRLDAAIAAGPAAARGKPAELLARPAVRLYGLTGERKYLEFAQSLAGAWAADKTLASQDAVEQLVRATTLLEVYRWSGKEELLAAAVGLADVILRDQSSLVGPLSSGRLWMGAQNQAAPVDKPMETCVTAAWMELLAELVRLKGDLRHVDELEKCLFNALAGAMVSDGSWWARYTSLMGERVPGELSHLDVGVNCCVLSGPRGLLLTPDWAVMTNAEGAVINLCFSGSVELKTPAGKPLTLVMESEYPRNGTTRVRLKLAQREEFTLAFRVPAWSEKNSARAKGEALDPRAGEYLKMRNTWQDDDRIELSLDMRGRIVDGPGGQAAVVRGPIVLAMDSRLVPAAESIRSRGRLDRSQAPTIALMHDQETARRIGAFVVLETPFEIDGARKILRLCDFASAGGQWTSRNCFRTWMPQPLNMGKLYDTGVSWQMLSEGKTRPRAPGR